MFLLVPAYPGSPGQKAVKRLCVCVCKIVKCDALKFETTEVKLREMKEMKCKPEVM